MCVCLCVVRYGPSATPRPSLSGTASLRAEQGVQGQDENKVNVTRRGVIIVCVCVCVCVYMCVSVYLLVMEPPPLSVYLVDLAPSRSEPEAWGQGCVCVRVQSLPRPGHLFNPT